MPIAATGPVDLFEDPEEPALFVVVVEDELRDVHARPQISFSYMSAAGNEAPMSL